MSGVRVTVLGGTGKIGRYVIDPLLAGGHEAVALVRTPAKLPIRHPARGEWPAPARVSSPPTCSQPDAGWCGLASPQVGGAVEVDHRTAGPWRIGKREPFHGGGDVVRFGDSAERALCADLVSGGSGE